jgi:hypothetical protein
MILSKQVLTSGIQGLNSEPTFHCLLTKFHKNLPVGSKDDGGGGGGRHTDRIVISLAYVFPLEGK